MKFFSVSSLALFCAAVALTIPCLSEGQKVNYTTAPWEIAVSGTYTRTDIPALPQSIAVLNTQLSTESLTQMATGDFNMAGGAIDLQRNFHSCLSLEFSFSGGTTNRSILIPSADTSAFPTGNLKASPKLYTAMFGPNFTMRRNHLVEVWFRILGGVARADVDPGSALNAAVLADSSPFTFSDTSAAADGGLGITVPFNRHLALRLGGDVVGTWLPAHQQGQLRASAGVVWRFGPQYELLDTTQFQ
jgi:hypothetical protein